MSACSSVGPRLCWNGEDVLEIRDNKIYRHQVFSNNSTKEHLVVSGKEYTIIKISPYLSGQFFYLSKSLGTNTAQIILWDTVANASKKTIKADAAGICDIAALPWGKLVISFEKGLVSIVLKNSAKENHKSGIDLPIKKVHSTMMPGERETIVLEYEQDISRGGEIVLGIIKDEGFSRLETGIPVGTKVFMSARALRIEESGKIRKVNTIVIATEDGEISYYDLDDGLVYNTIYGAWGKVTGVQLADSGEDQLTVTVDNSWVIKFNNGKPVSQVKLGQRVSDLAISGPQHAVAFKEEKSKEIKIMNI